MCPSTGYCYTKDPTLDLYKHLNMLFSRVNVSENSPGFLYGPNKFITYKTFTSRLKSLLKKCGVDPTSYSGHSFRCGGATYLHSLGGTGLQIQASGDWSTLTFLRYLHLTLEDRWSSLQPLDLLQGPHNHPGDVRQEQLLSVIFPLFVSG